MSPISILFILVAFLALCFRSLTLFSDFAKKKKKDPFLELSREGTANDLVFCSQEMLQNKVIGIDGIHRKIMILEKIRNKYNCSLISLNDVQNCKLVTRYVSSDNDAKNASPKKNLFAIELQFEFKNRAEAASIIFYDSLVNTARELVLLKAKAEYWSVMLSKMIAKPVKVRA